MNNLPLEIKYKIMSYLPILDDNKIKMNLEITKAYYFTKWCKYYKGISGYSLDAHHDDYFLNWLENDIIFILNKKVPLMYGIDKELATLIRIINGNEIYADEYTSPYFKAKSSIIVKKLLSLLKLNELHILDKNLEAYNYKLETGHSDAIDPFIIH
tara:strand:- start:2695 stop:3162 length:468 start_codon:yes stop_codon:yes gene_type:complete